MYNKSTTYLDLDLDKLIKSSNLVTYLDSNLNKFTKSSNLANKFLDEEDLYKDDNNYNKFNKLIYL